MIEKKGSWTSDLLGGIALAVGYFLISKIGLFFVIRPEGLTVLWPVSGFMLAVLLLSKRSRWQNLLPL